MRKYNSPLTYPPKIPKVLSGECTQTFRMKRRFKLGDLVSFHGWSGKPYRSPWSFRTKYFEIDYVNNIQIVPDGLMFDSCTNPGETYCIPWRMCGAWAHLDCIDPPTGEELGRVLLSMHKIPAEGSPAQIIRWIP